MQSNRGLVDVIIPTYQNDKLLHRAIESVISQGECVNQIWVVDDGSSPEIQQSILRRYSESEKVQVILIEHSGHPGVVRRIGIEKSTAKWIAFLDSDDWWVSSKLEDQLHAAALSGAHAVTSNARLFQNDQDLGLFHKRIPKHLTFKKMVKSNWVINSMLLVEREELIKIGTYVDSYRVRTPEDYATWLRLLCNVYILGLNTIGGGYEISETSIRKGDLSDPRIYAFADFLTWANSKEHQSRTRLKRKIILKNLTREYE